MAIDTATMCSKGFQIALELAIACLPALDPSVTQQIKPEEQKSYLGVVFNTKNRRPWGMHPGFLGSQVGTEAPTTESLESDASTASIPEKLLCPGLVERIRRTKIKAKNASEEAEKARIMAQICAARLMHTEQELETTKEELATTKIALDTTKEKLVQTTAELIAAKATWGYRLSAAITAYGNNYRANTLRSIKNTGSILYNLLYGPRKVLGTTINGLKYLWPRPEPAAKTT